MPVPLVQTVHVEQRGRPYVRVIAAIGSSRRSASRRVAGDGGNDDEHNRPADERHRIERGDAVQHGGDQAADDHRAAEPRDNTGGGERQTVPHEQRHRLSGRRAECDAQTQFPRSLLRRKRHRRVQSGHGEEHGDRRKDAEHPGAESRLPGGALPARRPSGGSAAPGSTRRRSTPIAARRRSPGARRERFAPRRPSTATASARAARTSAVRRDARPKCRTRPPRRRSPACRLPGTIERS